jgi:hypothetical protein
MSLLDFDEKPNCECSGKGGGSNSICTLQENEVILNGSLFNGNSICLLSTYFESPSGSIYSYTCGHILTFEWILTLKVDQLVDETTFMTLPRNMFAADQTIEFRLLHNNIDYKSQIMSIFDDYGLTFTFDFDWSNVTGLNTTLPVYLSGIFSRVVIPS